MFHVQGATPWTRDAVAELERKHPEVAAQIDAAVPDGHDIIVTAVNGVYGSWGAIIRNQEQIVARDRYGHATVAAACYAVLRAAREAVA